MIEASKPLPIFKLLMLASWLFLLSSAPFLPLLLPYLGALWLNAFWLSPQLIWAACAFLGARFRLQSKLLNGLAIVFSVVAGYVAFNIARHVHVSSLFDHRGWGDALDVWILTFVYCPVLLVLFSLLLGMRRWMGLEPLFEAKTPSH